MRSELCEMDQGTGLHIFFPGFLLEWEYGCPVIRA